MKKKSNDEMKNLVTVVLTFLSFPKREKWGLYMYHSYATMLLVFFCLVYKILF